MKVSNKVRVLVTVSVVVLLSVVSLSYIYDNAFCKSFIGTVMEVANEDGTNVAIVSFIAGEDHELRTAKLSDIDADVGTDMHLMSNARFTKVMPYDDHYYEHVGLICIFVECMIIITFGTSCWQLLSISKYEMDDAEVFRVADIINSMYFVKGNTKVRLSRSMVDMYKLYDACDLKTYKDSVLSAAMQMRERLLWLQKLDKLTVATTKDTVQKHAKATCKVFENISSLTSKYLSSQCIEEGSMTADDLTAEIDKLIAMNTLYEKEEI